MNLQEKELSETKHFSDIKLKTIVNKFSHLLNKNDLINNYKIYLKLQQTLKDSLVPISEMDDIEPVYKEWAKNRKEICCLKKAKYIRSL